MRNKKRILIVLTNLLDRRSVLINFLFFKNKVNIDIVKNIENNYEIIKNYWLINSDLRFGQLLCNLNLVTKEIENHIWNIEEDDWLIQNKYLNLEDIKFWGVNFFKNGKRRKKIKFVLLKDLKNDHIENILKYFNRNYNLTKLNRKYLEYFITRVYE